MWPLVRANTDSWTAREEWSRPTSVRDHGSIGKVARPSVMLSPRWRSLRACPTVFCPHVTSRARSRLLLKQLDQVLDDDVGARCGQFPGVTDAVDPDDVAEVPRPPGGHS